MKKFLVILILAVLGFFLFEAFSGLGLGITRFEEGVKDFYLDKTVSDLHVANTVTSIVVNFRGFDTLGEVTVLFLAVSAMGGILYKRRHHAGDRSVMFSSSGIVRSGSKLLFPAVILLGAYIFIHGHLSPGGGFQGGAIIATGFLLMLLAYEKFSVSHNTLSYIESFAGIFFVLFGLI